MDAGSSGNIEDIVKNCDDMTAFVMGEIHLFSAMKDDHGSELYQAENDEKVTLKLNL